MVYGLVTEKVKHHQSKLQKLVSFSDFKNLNVENLKDNLRTAPWNVGEMFKSVDDSYYNWTSLLNTIFKHMPVKVRAKDVPYMTPARTKATRAKCRFSKRFSQIRTPENFELKGQWRNEATKQRRITISKYWSELADDLRQNPMKFYKMFKPFLDRKDKGDGARDIHLNMEHQWK